MGIKITINSSEVKNPVVRFAITVVGILIFLVVFVFAFFLFFPLIWFLATTVLLFLIALLVFAPKLISQYRVIIIGKKKLDSDNNV